MPLGPLLVFNETQASNPGASVVTLYCANPVVSGASAGLLTTTQPAASTSTTGWTVGTTVASRFARQAYNSEDPALMFGTGTQPFGTPLGAGQDTWRYGPISGQFSLGTWYSSLSVIGVTSGGDQDGRVRVRLWRSASATGQPTGTGSDNFNRADAANRGANWTSVSGNNAIIAANQAGGNASGLPTLEYYNPLTPGAAQFARVVLHSPLETLAGGGCGPAVRIQTGADTGYIVKCNAVATERFQVLRRIAGAETGLFGYTAVAPAVGDVVELQISADWVLQLFVNGVRVAGPFTDTSASNLSGGRVGDFGLVVNDFIRWKDWDGGDLNAPGIAEITLGPGVMVGTSVTNLSTTVAQSSAASIRVPAFPVANEYLFMQAAWEVTGAGAAVDRDVLVRYGSMGATDGSGLVTAAFASSVVGTDVGPGMLQWYWQNVVED